MERLTQHVEERLRSRKICRVFSNEIDRVWPPSTKEQAARCERLKKIREFAESQGWGVVVRDAGLEAIFKLPKQG
jgi:hypothetical protein